MAALTYLLWLTTREGLRPETAAALVRRFGTAEAAYFADPGEYELLSLSERLCRSLADKSLERAERILGDCDRLGVTLLTYQDAAYPERLLQLHDFPLVLYVKGRLFRFDEELAVAIVGARECTPYGVAMAGRLGLELARSGALVLSGLAQGIDAAALKGALQGGGPAVSVLAGGVDVWSTPGATRDSTRTWPPRGPSCRKTRPAPRRRGGASPSATASSAACPRAWRRWRPPSTAAR